MKKIIYFIIFVFCIIFVYAQPAMPTIQIYGNIIGTVADGAEIAFEKDGIEVGLGTINNNQYGYDPVIFLDAGIGDSVDVFIDNTFITSITLQQEGAVNIDITMPAVPQPAPPSQEEEEEPVAPRRSSGGGLVIPAVNHTADFSQFPQTFNVRSGDKIFLTFNEVQHTIKVSRLRYQSVELLISSTPSTLNLNVDDEGEVDLNDDGASDIAVLYEGVEGNRGVIIIRELAQPAPVVITPEPAPEQEQEPAPQPEPEPEEPAPAAGFPWAAVIITIIILIIAGGIGFVFYEMKRSHGSLQEEKTQRTLDQQSYMRLQSYVKQTLEQGYAKEQIKQTLLNEGWSQNIVSKVLK